jgi:tetratricopeptide (TPR) repeat protein
MKSTSLVACCAVSLASLLAPAGAAQQPATGRPPTTTKSLEDRSGSQWYSRGMELHEDERWDEAITAFRKAIEAGHRVPAATYNVACGYARKGDRDLAFEWLGKAMDAGFDVASYLDDDDLDTLRDDRRWADLKAKARASRAGKDQSRVKAAVARFEALMARTPRDGRELFDNGRELLRVAEFDRAARAFVAAAEAGRREGTSLYNAACARALEGRKEDALGLLRRALDAGFDDPETMRKDDDLDALRSDPRFATLLEDAKALSLDGFPSLGARILRSERVAEATEAATRFEQYLKAHPASGRAWSNLGFVSLASEEPKEAARAFGKALELGYRKAPTMYNLACAHAQLKEKDKAFEWLDRAIDAGYADADHMEDDDDLWNLRRDPRFKKAVEKAKAAEERRGED